MRKDKDEKLIRAMSIWKTPLSIEELQKKCINTLVTHLGITFSEIGDDYLKAQMPFEDHLRQTTGIMHGGASCVLAETVASAAANCAVDLQSQYCVGLEINTNHIRQVSSGLLTAIARPYHLGRTTQVWSIEVFNDQEKLISISRLTVAVLNSSH